MAPSNAPAVDHDAQSAYYKVNAAALNEALSAFVLAANTQALVQEQVSTLI
jgi:hypothetical protein